MRRLSLIIAMLLCCTLAGAAKRYEIQYGPWVTNVTDSSFTILWTTPQRNLSFVELAPDDGTAFYAEVRPRYVQTIAGRNVMSRMHSVTITGLEPGKSYRYCIKGRDVRDSSDPYGIEYRKAGSDNKEYKARTLDPKADTCRFSMVNDMHFKADLYSSLLEGKTARDMDFLVLNGDIVSHSQSIDSVIKYTFSPAQRLLSKVPVVFARGNHESRGEDFDKVPMLFPTPTGQFYYHFRQGPVGFMILDGGEDKPDNSVEYSGYAHFDDYRAAELEWLKSAIKSPEFADAPVKVVIIHMPPYAQKKSWYAQKWIHENFLPLLNEAGVDLLLGGHHHTYFLNEPGTTGNAFPIMVNSNVERLDFMATASGISVSTYDASGAMTHHLDLRK